MRTIRHARFIVLALLALSPFNAAPAFAQAMRFFRVSGPAASKTIAFRLDGTLVWTNAQAGTYTIQTVSSLPGGTNWVDYVQIPATNVVSTNLLLAFNPPTNMALVPAGEFQMGDSADHYVETDPVHTNYVSAIYLDNFPVTKALWDGVYQWAITNGYNFDNAGSGKALNHPVQTINWYDCVKWCNARSEQEGRVPAYYTDAGQTLVYRSGTNDLASAWVKWNAGYRLPTEAEWEKAARGGLSGKRFPSGDTISQSQANYFASPSDYSYDLSPQGYHPAFSSGLQPHTSPVGSFAANGYGLYDLAGNVSNWCWDWFGPYGSDPQSDPSGPDSGLLRVFRDGGWSDGAFYCRTAFRNGNNATYAANGLGFRTVLPLAQARHP